MSKGFFMYRLVERVLTEDEKGRTLLASLESCEIELFKLANAQDVIP